MYLNEGTLLNNLRRRYKKDLIYVIKIQNKYFFYNYFSLRLMSRIFYLQLIHIKNYVVIILLIQ
jgi:hypothetical protein